MDGHGAEEVVGTAADVTGHGRAGLTIVVAPGGGS